MRPASWILLVLALAVAAWIAFRGPDESAPRSVGPRVDAVEEEVSAAQVAHSEGAVATDPVASTEAGRHGAGHAAREEVAAPKPSAVYGLVTRRGEPLLNREVQIVGRSADGEQVTETVLIGADGTYRVEVPDGGYRIGVVQIYTPGTRVTKVRSGREQRQNFGLSLPREVVVAGVDQRVDLEAYPGRIEIRVRDTAGVPVPNVGIGSNISMGWMTRTTSTDDLGFAFLDETPMGTFEIRLGSKWHVAVPKQNATVTAARPVAIVDFVLEPAGQLEVALVEPGGERVEISAALDVRVASVTAPTQNHRSGTSRTSGRPTALEFTGLRPGRYAVSIADAVESEAATVRYQPIEPPAEQFVDVRAGQRETLEMRVRYRAYTRIRGVRSGGALAEDATLTVRHLAEGRHVLPGPWQRGSRHNGWHFDGYLAPGTYALEFASESGGHWRELLTVTYAPVEKTVALP